MAESEIPRLSTEEKWKETFDSFVHLAALKIMFLRNKGIDPREFLDFIIVKPRLPQCFIPRISTWQYLTRILTMFDRTPGIEFKILKSEKNEVAAKVRCNIPTILARRNVTSEDYCEYFCSYYFRENARRIGLICEIKKSRKECELRIKTVGQSR